MFGERLKELRKQRGWSQEELGNKLGLTKQTVSRYESGRTPDIETIMRIAEVFEVPFGTLVQEYDWSAATVFADDDDRDIVQKMTRQNVMVPMPENKVKLHKLVDQIPPDKADTVLAMLQGLLAGK